MISVIPNHVVLLKNAFSLELSTKILLTKNVISKEVLKEISNKLPTSFGDKKIAGIDRLCVFSQDNSYRSGKLQSRYVVDKLSCIIYLNTVSGSGINFFSNGKKYNVNTKAGDIIIYDKNMLREIVSVKQILHVLQMDILYK